MKIIIRCPRCHKDVAIDRGDQLPLPTAPPQESVRFLKEEIEKLQKQIRDQRYMVPKITQLEQENAHLRTVVSNLRSGFQTEGKWKNLALGRQVKITTLEREKYILQRAAGRSDHVTYDGSHILVNGTSVIPVSDIKY